MGTAFKKNKKLLALAVAAGILVVGTGIYAIIRGREPSSSKCLAPKRAMVTKVLDGDTVIVEGGHHVRLLGIDADEGGYPCYEEAKSQLEKLVLNEEVRLEKDKTDIDQYDRCLRYIFSEERNINLQLVKEGVAVARFYPPDTKYQEEITEAEKKAIEGKIGCKWSEDFSPKKSSEEEEKPVRKEWEELTTAKLGYDRVDAWDAGEYLGRELIVEGKIVDSYHSRESNTVFLNFGKPYPNQCFTAVIFSSDLHKFVQNPEDYYSGKTVRITGEVKEYEGRPEIILENPSQIEVGE